MIKVQSQVSQECVQSVLSRFLNPVTAESLSHVIVQSFISGESRPELLNRLQSKLSVAGIAVSQQQMNLWLDRMVCSDFLKPVRKKTVVQDGLHPVVAKKADQLVKQSLAKGYKIRLIQGWRSFVDQDELFKSGQGVTNARGGQSFHNYGLAFDVAFVNSQGEISFDLKHNWKMIGEIGKSLGLKWGGDFRKIKDLGHFEWHPGMSIGDVQSLYHDEGLDGILRIQE